MPGNQKPHRRPSLRMQRAKQRGETPELAPLMLKVALDVASQRGTLKSIAQEHGIDDSTLMRWMHLEEFQTQVAEFIRELRETQVRVQIANRDARLLQIQREYDLVMSVILERQRRFSDDAALLDLSLRRGQVAPGAETGLLALDWKDSKRGGWRAVFRYDAALVSKLAELRAETAKLLLEPGFVNPKLTEILQADEERKRKLDEAGRLDTDDPGDLTWEEARRRALANLERFGTGETPPDPE